MKLYHRLPARIQNLVVSAHGVYWKLLTQGPGFRQAVRTFRARDSWTREAWEQWTRDRLRRVLFMAGTRVPYYRETWSPAIKKSAEKGYLTDLPLLKRKAVQENPWAFVVENSRSHSNRKKPRRWRYMRTFYTSGSTGTPIVTVWKRSEIVRAHALREARAFEPAGVSLSMKRAVMNGRAIFQPERPGDPVVRYDLAGRRLHLSPFHLQPDRVGDYVHALERFRPVWILGYAVSLGILARMIRSRGLRVPPVRAIITISEPLLPWARKVLEDVFRCRVYEEYGLVENVCYAVECEHGRLHVSPDAGVIEILRPDGSACEPGESGEIVATGFLRWYQPFIRYCTGDRAAWDDRPCACGRRTPVLQSVEGRVEDILVGPDGRAISRIHTVFVGALPVQEAQVIQEAPDRLRVRLVPLPGFHEGHEREIIRRIRVLMGSGVGVTVERVRAIERTPAGKFRATIHHKG